LKVIINYNIEKNYWLLCWEECACLLIVGVKYKKAKVEYQEKNYFLSKKNTISKSAVFIFLALFH